MAGNANGPSCAELAVLERSGIWRVTINGRFYGDYTKEEWAIEAALDEAQKIRRQGKAASIRLVDGKTGSPRVVGAWSEA